MTLGTLALALGALLAAGAFAAWLYRAREVPIDGSVPLIAARAIAIALVLLLLINPRIPGGAAFDGGSSWTLVDQSGSMGAALNEGGSAWERAGDEAGDGAVVLFGGTPSRAPIASAQPTAATSRLQQGLRLAIEAGARELRVVSDFRVSDFEGSIALLERSGVGVDLVPVGGPVRNVGLSRFDVGLGAGGTIADVEVFGELAAGDSAQIEIRLEGRSVATQSMAVPEPGARERVTIELPPAAATGEPSRYTAVATLPGDGFPDDNERVAYVRTGADDGGVVLISTAPDWEPRFLLPTLRDVTGFDGEGYLAVGDGRFLRSFSDDGSVVGVDSASVRRRAFRAEVVVLHSTGTLDEWTRSWFTRLNRLIVVAPDPATLASLGVTAAASRGGEWYVQETAPSSPISGGLSGLNFEDLPPLGPVVTIDGASGWSSALHANLGRGGAEAPVLILTGGRRRVAVATAQGWWRWAFREGTAREAYRRVWSAVAGWMMGGEARVASDQVEPAAHVSARDEPVAWTASGLRGDTVHLRIGTGAPFLVDTVVAIDSTEAFRTPVMDPGHYRYSAVSGTDSTAGRFDVEAFSNELLYPVADLEGAAAAAPSSMALRVSGGRRLRTAGLPYFLLIAVLSIEWLLRRRKGLR